MTLGMPCRAALVGAACWLVPVSIPSAQTTATVDLGLSAVKYDGFLLSGAGALTPALTWERPRGSLSVRGTYLRFESGNRSLQGLVAGSLFTPVARRWRGELSATAGASSYADFASFWHGLVEARLHRVSGNRGAWIGGTAGRTSFGGTRRPAAAVAIGAWTQRAGLVLIGSAGRAFIGDTAYTDIETTARAQRGALVLETAVGARVWSHGGGRGVYGEGSVTIALSTRMALVVSGGRYPADPIRGSISGRYAGVALRFSTVVPKPPPPARPRDPRWDPSSPSSPVASEGGDGASAIVHVEILPQGDGAVRFVVRATEAALVEIAGDFSDWQPVSLGRAPGGPWQVVVRIPSGIHRIAVRVDRGPWTAPAGARRVADDFGGEVGLFVVP